MKHPLYSMTVTSWMGCIYLEEHLWWIWWNVLVVFKDPLTVGWGASVEMIGLADLPTLLSLSVVTGVVTLAIGVAGNIEFPFNWLKES